MGTNVHSTDSLIHKFPVDLTWQKVCNMYFQYESFLGISMSVFFSHPHGFILLDESSTFGSAISTAFWMIQTVLIIDFHVHLSPRIWYERDSKGLPISIEKWPFAPGKVRSWLYHSYIYATLDWHVLTKIKTWIRDNIHSILWDIITHPYHGV